MTGWRVGWMIGPTDLVKAATNLQSHATSNVSNVAQRAALAAVSGDLHAVDEMKTGLRPAAPHDRRDAQRDRRRRLPDAARRVLRLPVGEGPARQGLPDRRRAGRLDTSAELAELHPRPGRGRRGARARRSGRRAISGSPTPSATTTWSRASAGCRSCFAVSRDPTAARRPCRCATLPKAHLHLHFTGSMRHRRCSSWPSATASCCPTRWSRTGRRSCRPPTRRAGSASSGSTTWPARCCAPRTTYAGWCWRPPRTTSATAGAGWRSRSTRAGTPPASAGSPPFTDLVLDAVRDAAERTGLGIAVVIAANRTRHPLDARTLARLAAQYAGRGVVGFGLSNDERRGTHRRLRAGVRDRRAGRPDAGPARRRAARPRARAGLPRRAARRPARPRDPRRRGPGAARPGRRRPGSRSRCARSPTSRSASTPT